MPSEATSPRVLILSHSASDRFGGESVLPLHYFRQLLSRGEDAVLITHERVKGELEESLGDAFQRVRFVHDTRLDQWIWAVLSVLPQRIRSFLTLATLGSLTEIRLRQLAKKEIALGKESIVHVPAPVSPKHASFVYGLGAPVVFGPLNGGMEYPKAFQREHTSALSSLAIAIGRRASHLLNWVIPGKRLAARVLVANERTDSALPAGCRERVTVLVENAVEIHSLPDVSAQQRNPAQFVFVGRLVQWKGVQYLLEALAEANRRMSLSLRIIGDGEYADELRSHAKALDIESRAEFMGFMPREHAIAEICTSQALVLPSVYECGGAVVLEAMACETPVIATNWGGPQDYVTPECGVLVDPTNRRDFVQGLADAMVMLASAPELAASMGRAGRERVLQDYTWEGKIERILHIYDEVLAEPRGN